MPYFLSAAAPNAAPEGYEGCRKLPSAVCPNPHNAAPFPSPKRDFSSPESSYSTHTYARKKKKTFFCSNRLRVKESSHFILLPSVLWQTHSHSNAPSPARNRRSLRRVPPAVRGTRHHGAALTEQLTCAQPAATEPFPPRQPPSGRRPYLPASAPSQQLAAGQKRRPPGGASPMWREAREPGGSTAEGRGRREGRKEGREERGRRRAGAPDAPPARSRPDPDAGARGSAPWGKAAPSGAGPRPASPARPQQPPEVGLESATNPQSPRAGGTAAPSAAEGPLGSVPSSVDIPVWRGRPSKTALGKQRAAPTVKTRHEDLGHRDSLSDFAHPWQPLNSAERLWRYQVCAHENSGGLPRNPQMTQRTGLHLSVRHVPRWLWDAACLCRGSPAA